MARQAHRSGKAFKVAPGRRRAPREFSGQTTPAMALIVVLSRLTHHMDDGR